MSLTNILLTLLLLAMPFTTVADEYAAVREKLKLCTTCHGPKGAKPQLPQYPILAGQEFYYLYVQLKDFKSGLREDPIMKPIASTLDKQEMQALAKYFSEQNWPNIGHKASDEDIKVGKKVVHAGECVACHLGSFTGSSRIPRLAGQNGNCYFLFMTK